MIDLSTINILIALLIILVPLFGALAKDGAKLVRDIKEALADRELTNDEIDLILKDAGFVLRSLVRIIEKIFTR